MGILGVGIARQSRGTSRRRGSEGSVTLTNVSAAARALVGDPDGTKARAASARSRHAEPMHPIDRQWRYLEQTGRGVLTAAQRRRALKKMRRHGMVSAVAADAS